MNTRESDPCYMLDQYEALRREAIEAIPSAPRGQGLALFLARGMSVWLAALAALGPRDKFPPPLAQGSVHDQGPGPPPCARRELTRLLAAMVLSCTETKGER